MKEDIKNYHKDKIFMLVKVNKRKKKGIKLLTFLCLKKAEKIIKKFSKKVLTKKIMHSIIKYVRYKNGLKKYIEK